MFFCEKAVNIIVLLRNIVEKMLKNITEPDVGASLSQSYIKLIKTCKNFTNF